MAVDPQPLWEAFVRQPDERSFEPLYEATKRLVFTLCARTLRDPEDAADAMQMTYARLVAYAREGTPPDLDQIVYRTAVREAQNLRARRARLQRREVDVEDLSDRPHEAIAAGDQADLNPLREQLDRLVDRLPDDLQAPLVLHYFLGQTQTEIARSLGLSKMTVSRRLRQGLRRLRPLARRAGLGIEAAVLTPLTAAVVLMEPAAAMSAGFVYRALPELTAAAAGATAGTGAGAGSHAGSGLFASRMGAWPALGLVGLSVLWFAVIVPHLLGDDGPKIDWSGWRSVAVAGDPGFSRDAGGVGIEMPERGTTIGDWVSPDRLIALEPNAVYELRLRVESDQREPGRTPMWAILLQDYSWAGDYGHNTFSGEAYFVDHQGTNAPTSGHFFGPPGREFRLWFAPPAVLTPQWNDPATGAFAPAHAGQADMRVVFRVIDIDGRGYGAESDLGRVTLREFEVWQHDLREMIDEETVYESGALRGGERSTHHVAATFDRTRYAFEEGTLTVAPRDESGWTDEFIRVNVGDEIADLNDGRGVEDNWPVFWDSDQLYLVEADLSAPDAIGEQNPPDRIAIGMDSATQELIALGVQTPSMGGMGTPRRGAPQRYAAFFHGNHATAAESPLRALRPRMELVSNFGQSFDGQPTNRGAVTLHAMRVRRVRFPAEKARRVFPVDETAPLVANVQ
jgi:RNA polymerase sigma factor (sigma-70 family)